MTSSNDGTDRQPVHDEAANPFVVFRRFADEQMSSLLQSVIGLPTNFKSRSSTAQASSFDDDVWLQETRELRRHLSRESEEAARIVNIFKKARDEVEGKIHEEVKISRCPYRPVDQEVPQRNQDLSSDFLPEPPTPPRIPELSSWPLVFAAGIPCSQLWLECQEPFRARIDGCKNTSDDLRVLQSRKGDVRRDEDEADARAVSMLCSGVFGDGPYGLHQQSSEQPSAMDGLRKSKNNENENEVTELDLYERFLGSQYPSVIRTPQPLQNSTSLNSKSEHKQEGLVSTLTTTERSKLSDGSIHTKVVLKRRFADGREESTETVHTTYDSQQPQSQPATPPNTTTKEVISKIASDVEVKDSRRKGWFWS